MFVDHARYETEFAAETDRLGLTAVALAPDRPVLTCPEWTVRDLVAHVGTGHRWSAAIIETRADQPPPYVGAQPPSQPDEWPGWLRSGADRLLDAVSTAGPHQRVWTWQTDRSAGFWLRRMYHDEVVHRFDLELTAGGMGDLATDLAAAGIRDWLDTVAHLSTMDGSAMRGLAGHGETLNLCAPDAGAGWLVRRTPAGVTWSEDAAAAGGAAVRGAAARDAGSEDAAAADVTVRGPARELLLVLNRRLGSDRLQVAGDTALFADWLEHSQF